MGRREVVDMKPYVFGPAMGYEVLISPKRLVYAPVSLRSL